MRTRLPRLLAPLAASMLLLGACSDPVVVSDDPGPTKASDRNTKPPKDEPSDPETSSSGGGTESTVAAYFIADTERAGPRLYREFQRQPGPPLDAAVAALMEPQDPDYRSPWTSGTISSVGLVDDVITVVVDPSVHDRPSEMSKAEAKAAVQAVVYTMQAAVQQRAAVQFTTDGNPIDQVFGVPTSEPITNAPVLSVLSHVSLTSPEQGQVVDDGTLEVSGVGNSFEANLGWEIRRGDAVVDDGFLTMEGWMEPKLFPFETSVDVAGLEPGEYTLWVTTDDPSGGEGIGAMTDDRDFVVE